MKTLLQILLHAAQLGGAVAFAIFFFQWFAWILGGSLLISYVLHRVDRWINSPNPR